MNKGQIEHISEGRIPPQAIEIEEAVLGACLIEEQAKQTMLDRLNPRDFYKSAHRHIFEAIQFLEHHEGGTDMLSVEQYLRDAQILEQCGGVSYLSELTRSVSSAANMDYHCQILREKSTKRDVILGCTDVIKKAYSPESDPFDVLDQLVDTYRRIEQQSFMKLPSPSAETVKQVLTDVITARNVVDGIVGVPTYLPIDNLTAGFPPGEVIYIASRPSMGKTAFMLTIVMNLLVSGFKKPLLIFSYEMDEHSLLLRLLCMIARVNMHYARRGKLNMEEKQKLAAAASALGVEAKIGSDGVPEFNNRADSLLFIEDDNRIHADEILAVARRIETEYGLGAVFVDYLQLVPVSNPHKKNLHNREQEVAYISRQTKLAAKELRVPFINLSQLSRKVEDRKGDNRPHLGDLRESGSIEQDATMVMFLYRPEYYDISKTPEGISTEGLCEVILKKNRNGPTGTEKHEFIKQFALFRKWDEEKALLKKGSGPPDRWIQGQHDPGEDPSDDLPF